MGRRKWMGLLIGALMAVSLFGCSQVPVTKSNAEVARAPSLGTPSPRVESTTSQPAAEAHASLGTAVPTPSSTPMPTRQQVAQEQPLVVNPTTLIPSDPTVHRLVEQAKEDLALRLGIPVDGIAIISVIRQRFSTDAFFCRTTKARNAKDESPAIVSGESILLSAQGRRYEYHASDETVIFCRELR